VDQPKLINRLRTWGATLGPYVLLEVAMPGGSLMALLLYLHRRRQSAP
jgi:hypothetical protein